MHGLHASLISHEHRFNRTETTHWNMPSRHKFPLVKVDAEED